MDKILLSFLFTVIIYFFVPALGILSKFLQWRRFRNNVRESLLFPVVGRDKDIRPGEIFRFYGRFDALDSAGFLWIKGKYKTISIPFEFLNIFMLPSNHSRIVEGLDSFSMEGMKQLKNYSFKTLEEGTPLFAFGRMTAVGEEGIKGTISVIIHEETMTETLIPSAIFMGDVPSLWFNSVTFISWIFGFAFFLFLSLIPAVSSSYRFLFKIFISEALFPLLFFAPPGGLLSLLFFRLWRKGQFSRRRYELKKLFSFCEEHISFLGQGDFECIRKICFEQNVLGEDLRHRFSFKGSLIAPAVFYIICAFVALICGAIINFVIAIIVFGKIGSL